MPFYGSPVGIFMLERMGSGTRPYISGDTGNASTWSVPVRYNVARILGPEGGELTSAVVQAATDLVHEGVQLITCGCGYSLRYREAVRAAVDVPVFLSSLLLAPFLEKMLPPNKALGIVVASRSSLTEDLLATAGLRANLGRRMVVAGLEDAPMFAVTWIKSEGDLDINAVESDVVDAAESLVRDRPDIGMLLLECGALPSYAAAVQRAIGIPVYDYTSMIEFFAGGLVRRPFTGSPEDRRIDLCRAWSRPLPRQRTALHCSRAQGLAALRPPISRMRLATQRRRSLPMKTLSPSRSMHYLLATNTIESTSGETIYARL
ncbi:hypothetical protein [Bradyrhizobium japonicum]|uniref:hypothetical protein n=1 Tax=Bradyrhizobium japonicum TaxID=375 RepID=UPI0006935E4E|nr:hypothetical protein [Bradyrhizobium japonicum]